MDKPFSSWVQWDNTVCNPLAPSREQTQSAWQHGYESGFVDGMSKRAQSSVDKAVTDMCRKWQGLTDEDVDEVERWIEFKEDGSGRIPNQKLVRYIEAKLKDKNS